MKAGKLVPIAIFSACLTACGGGGGGNAVRPDPPPTSTPPPGTTPPPPGTPSPAPGSSLSEVPEEYREIVSSEKTIPLVINDDGETFSLTIDGKTEEYNFSDLPNGTTADLPVILSYQTVQGAPATASGTLLVYQQPYSVVTGVTWAQDSGDEFENDELGIFYSAEILGFRTPASTFADLIAQNAIFDYKGVAFDGQEEATFNYRVLFGTREGHGSIAGFTRTGLITLWPQQIDNDWIIRGKAHMEKAFRGEPYINYELAFFGPNAEEIAGDVYDPTGEGLLGDSEIIFAGKR